MFDNFVSLGGTLYNADRIESITEGDGFMHVAISGRAEASVKIDSPDGARLKELIATGGRQYDFAEATPTAAEFDDAFRHVAGIVRPEELQIDSGAVIRDIETMKAVIDKDTPILREIARTFGLSHGDAPIDVEKILKAAQQRDSTLARVVGALEFSGPETELAKAITGTLDAKDKRLDDYASEVRELQQKLDKANEDLKAAQDLLDSGDQPRRSNE